jgi:Tfp pilus assembly protein PilP
VADRGTLGPLEQFELEQLNVTAVIWSTEKPRALVEDPSGRSYVVHEGTRIGKNDGLVIHIGDNLVLVKETYVDFAGAQTTKDVELRIRRSQGG